MLRNKGYTALERNIDHKRQFIYLHIPKTAGTAIKKALFLNPDAGHAKPQKFIRYLGQKRFRRYFKITFVRNPWDRFVSFYHYARMEENYYHSAINPDKALYGKNRHYDLLKDATVNDAAHMLIEGMFKPVQGTFDFMAPQVEWLLDEAGELIPDFIGKYEQLQPDLDKLQKLIDIPLAPLEKLNASKSNNGKYREYYDAETRGLVERYYERDIDLLGYTF